MPTKNYVFAAWAPTLNAALVSEQIISAHRYRNRLCELEHHRRAAAERTIRRLSPEYATAATAVDAAEKAVAEILAAVKAKSAIARKRVPVSPEHQEALTRAREIATSAFAASKSSKKAAYDQLKELQKQVRVQADTEVTDDALTPAARKSAVKVKYLELAEIAQIDAGEAAFERNSKLARAVCGCYWGTYLMVEDQAKHFGHGPPPRFKRWNGEGTIAIQLQGGLSVEEALKGDTRLQLNVKNQEELAVRGASRGVRSRGTVRFRIGTTGRDPLWTELPVQFHRLLPANGDIRWAYIDRRRIGTHDKWQLRLVINTPIDGTASAPAGGRVAIHPGWRTMPDGSLRVAVWAGDDGDSGEILLPNRLVTGDRVPSDLQSIRDLERETRKRPVINWLTDHFTVLPGWLQEASSTIGLWTAQSRFAWLSWMWFDKRLERVGHTRASFLALARSARDEILASIPDEVPGEGDAWRSLDRYRNWDKHLLDWSSSQHKKARARRDDIYRCAAKKLSMRYRSMVITDTKWSEILSHPELTSEEDVPKPAPIEMASSHRHRGRFASPATLIRMCREKFTDSIIVPAKHVTSRCHACGNVGKVDRRGVMCQCQKCGITWDQDMNAALNQLKAAETQEKPVSLDSEEPGQEYVRAGEPPLKLRRNRKSPHKAS